MKVIGFEAFGLDFWAVSGWILKRHCVYIDVLDVVVILGFSKVVFLGVPGPDLFTLGRLHLDGCYGLFKDRCAK